MVADAHSGDDVAVLDQRRLTWPMPTRLVLNVTILLLCFGVTWPPSRSVLWIAQRLPQHPRFCPKGLSTPNLSHRFRHARSAAGSVLKPLKRTTRQRPCQPR